MLTFWSWNLWYKVWQTYFNQRPMSIKQRKLSAILLTMTLYLKIMKIFWKSGKFLECENFKFWRNQQIFYRNQKSNLLRNCKWKQKFWTSLSIFFILSNISKVFDKKCWYQQNLIGLDKQFAILPVFTFKPNLTPNFVSLAEANSFFAAGVPESPEKTQLE